MSHPLLRYEPVIWVLFGQGIIIGSMLLTGWLLVVGVLAPLGLVPAEALSYERAHALASSWIGRLVLVGLLALPLWKGAHHVRHFFIDLGYADHDGPIGGTAYAVATIGSIVAILAVVRLVLLALGERVLEGIRVLDLTRVVAGPFATALLADLGADVVKIERPRTGDEYRFGPSLPGETSLSFQNTNRGKRSVTLDVRRDEGRELFLRLVDGADAVVENFRAGWMARRGVGSDVVRDRNPRCVFASLSGFGQTGPYAGRASYDIVAQATGGLMAMTGPAGGPPIRGGGALGDYIGGLYLALGVVAALFDRERDQAAPRAPARPVDLSNQDAIFAVTDSVATIFQGIGATTERIGNDHPFACPYGAFEARDGWLAIATGSNRLFRKLCAGMGTPDLSEDALFQHHAERARNREDLHSRIAAWVAARSCDEVLRVLGPDGVDIPCAKVSAPEELTQDPQLLARGMIERHPHPTLGEVLFHGDPLKLGAPRKRALAPALGEHNAEIYGELGLAEADLARLAELGVI